MQNKSSILFFLGVAFWMLPSFVFAEPSNLNMSDNSLQNGQGVAISGIGFGLKSTPTPRFYDEFERATLNTTANFGVWSGINNMNSSADHQRYPASMYAAHKNFIGYDTGGVEGNGTSRKWFVNIWVYFDQNFDWGTSGYGDGDQMLSNIKFPVRFWKGSGESNIYNSLGWGLDERGFNNVEFSPDDGLSFSDTTLTKNGLTKNQWHQFAQEFVDSSGAGTADCEWRLWWNGKKVFERVNFRCNSTDEYRYPLFIGFYNAWGPPVDSAPNDYYIDDIYVDTTLQRIEICDNANRLNATHCEMQIPTAWEDTTATFIVKAGSFDDGTAYLFVFDDTGASNANGFPITFGSGSSDTTPPTAPAGLSVI